MPQWRGQCAKVYQVGLADVTAQPNPTMASSAEGVTSDQQPMEVDVADLIAAAQPAQWAQLDVDGLSNALASHDEKGGEARTIAALNEAFNTLWRESPAIDGCARG